MVDVCISPRYCDPSAPIPAKVTFEAPSGELQRVGGETLNFIQNFLLIYLIVSLLINLSLLMNI
jgi:hypothetical protein